MTQVDAESAHCTAITERRDMARLPSPQPSVCQFNLARLAEALTLIVPHEMLDPELAKYKSLYQEAFLTKMRRKVHTQTHDTHRRDNKETSFVSLRRRQLGLGKSDLNDQCLVDDLIATLTDTGADYTNVMRTSPLVVFACAFVIKCRCGLFHSLD